MYKTIKDVCLKLYDVDYVKRGATSPYHDEIGHVITGLIFSNWYLAGINKPIVISTYHIAEEQLAELSQRMMTRVSSKVFRDIQQDRIHALGTLKTSTITRINSKLNLQNKPKINWPDVRGRKLTFEEAIKWVNLFTLEDSHIFLKCMSPSEKSIELDKYIEEVALTMYLTALNIDTESRVKDLFNTFLNLESTRKLQHSESFKEKVLRMNSKDTLKKFYDNFIPYFKQMDELIKDQMGKTLSSMTVEEIHKLPLDLFNDIHPPFNIVKDINSPSSTWRGTLEYCEIRDLYMLCKITPAEQGQPIVS